MSRPTLSSVLPACLPLFLVPVLEGCRSCRIEYDAMRNTSFPQDQTVAGEVVSLESIFSKAGIGLVVVEDEDDIPRLGLPPLPGIPVDDTINDAELDNLEANHRTDPVAPEDRDCGWWIFQFTCTRHYLHGLVVDYFYEWADGTRRTNIMGVMWTPDRRAFANFFKNSTVSGDPGKYLRSAAHEIGHGFNLHHDDGDGATTIMNQTGVVGDNYVYEFSQTEKDHLKLHPVGCVWPAGGGQFEHCSTDHDSHVTQDCPGD
jgi:hypothetical protein